MNAVVAERGQVTVPKVLRERLGIVPGTILDFTEERGKLVAVKKNLHDPVIMATGCLKGKNMTSDKLFAELRG